MNINQYQQQQIENLFKPDVYSEHINVQIEAVFNNRNTTINIPGVQLLVNTVTSVIQWPELIEQLEKSYSFIKNSIIEVYNEAKNEFESAGEYPNLKDVTVDYCQKTQLLCIKCMLNLLSKKKVPRAKRQKKFSEKRVKERQIQQVLDKVAEWRELFTNQKMCLDKAAEVVGISRKTLDDYNLQIKRAEQYRFDFHLHKDEKMGVLRKFVKDKMQQDDQMFGNQFFK